MTTFKALAGVVAVGIVLQAAGAHAQENPQAAGAPSSGECSGIHCILGWHLDSAPSQAAPSQAAPVPVESRSVDPGASSARVPTAPSSAAGEAHAKPVHIVTIVAGPSEAARLAALAAALPTKVKIVKSGTPERVSTSDFVVSTSLERPSSGTRLFTEQLHVIAGSGIRAFGDLDGKLVSFGPDKSASQMAARKAFEALNIKVRETPLDLDNALDGLTTGDLDAVVVLAPQPLARLKSVSAPGIHLVSWPQGGTLPEGARATRIDASAYPSLAGDGAAVSAMGVEASLMPRADKGKDAAAKIFLKALSQNSDALAKRGFDLIKADAGRDRHLAAADR